jgi:LPS-assembly lipoprotein
MGRGQAGLEKEEHRVQFGRRRVLGLLGFGLAAAGLPLSGCGFEPIYGRTGDRSVVDDLAAVRVALIPDRSGQILRNYLLDTLTPAGQPVNPRYTLAVSLEEPRRELAIRRDDTPTRVVYSITARFRLQDAAGRQIYAGTSVFDSDYEITNSEFATLANRQSARDRLLQRTSEEIRLQLAAYFRIPKTTSSTSGG